MKSEERHNQMEELLLKSLNSTKTSENDTTFYQGTIYSTIETFEYVPENDKTFDAFYRRYEMWTAKNGQTKKRYVYYSGNWVQLNRVGSLILSPPQKKPKTVKLLSELLGRTHHFFIRDGNALIYLKMTSKIIWRE